MKDKLKSNSKETPPRKITEHPDLSGECLDLLMIAKYLERIGDHAVNVAEWVEYSITGAHAGE